MNIPFPVPAKLTLESVGEIASVEIYSGYSKFAQVIPASTDLNNPLPPLSKPKIKFGSLLLNVMAWKSTGGSNTLETDCQVTPPSMLLINPVFPPVDGWPLAYKGESLSCGALNAI